MALHNPQLTAATTAGTAWSAPIQQQLSITEVKIDLYGGNVNSKLQNNKKGTTIATNLILADNVKLHRGARQSFFRHSYISWWQTRTKAQCVLDAATDTHVRLIDGGSKILTCLLLGMHVR